MGHPVIYDKLYLLNFNVHDVHVFTFLDHLSLFSLSFDKISSADIPDTEITLLFDLLPDSKHKSDFLVPRTYHSNETIRY